MVAAPGTVTVRRSRPPPALPPHCGDNGASFLTVVTMIVLCHKFVKKKNILTTIFNITGFPPF